MEHEEFDSIVGEVEIPNELEIELVDDTPEKDKGKKVFEGVEPPEGDELDEYSEAVQKRLKDYSWKFHNERRRAEQALREQYEAVRAAQAILQENKQLKETLTWGQQQFVENYKQGIEAEEKWAEDKYRKAYEAGDTEGVLEAQKAMQAALLKKTQLGELQKPIVDPNYLQNQNNVVYNPPQQAPQTSRDYKAEDWASKNAWFGQDEEMTSFAYGLHQKLVNSGIDPASDEYYQRIDSRIREKFPENFYSDRATQVEPTPKPRKSSPVAPVSRSTASKKVTLTSSALAIAKRLGVSPEDYAKQMLKLQNR